MLKQIYKIDINGYAVTLNNELPFNQRSISSLYLEDDEEIPEGYVQAPDTSTQQLWLPKWNGENWVEGLSQAEIDALNNVSQQPTDADYLLDLDFRISMIELGI